MISDSYDAVTRKACGVNISFQVQFFFQTFQQKAFPYKVLTVAGPAILFMQANLHLSLPLFPILCIS